MHYRGASGNSLFVLVLLNYFEMSFLEERFILERKKVPRFSRILFSEHAQANATDSTESKSWP